MWLLAFACKSDPLELAIELGAASEVAPLVRHLLMEATEPVTVSAEWSSEDHAVVTTFPAGPASQDLLLLGMRADRTYDLVVTVRSESGEEAQAEDQFTTAALAAHFPVAEVIAGTGVREPGDTLIPMHSFISNTEPNDLATVWDEEGQLIYWLDTQEFLYDVQEFEGGLLALVGEDQSRLVHYGWDGEELNSWSTVPEAGAELLVDVDKTLVFHHDMGSARFEPGQFLGLGRYSSEELEYPQSYNNLTITGPETVAIDTVVEFASDGSLISEFSIDAVIPVSRIGYDSLSDTVEGWSDWAHANAVIEDDDGNWIVSLRHQDVVVKIDRETYEPIWLLGNHEYWPPALQEKLLEPTGEMRWQYHQHGPELAPRGPDGKIQLIVFDNGNAQTSPFTPVPPVTNPYSRVVQFEIDEAAMTVRQVWAHETPNGGLLFSEAVGNADHLPGGTVLSSWGFLDKLPEGKSNVGVGLGKRSVRIIEIEPAPPVGIEVETLHLHTDGKLNDEGWTGYRAERIANLEGRVATAGTDR